MTYSANGFDCAVSDSPDLRRVLALPRQTVEEKWARACDLAYEMSPLVARRPGLQLRPLQALALSDLAEFGGAFVGLRCDGGKTLLSRLAPIFTAARRPWLIVPGGLRDKTRDEFAALERDWISPEVPPILHGFQELARVKQADLFDRERPDLIVIDEGHKTRNHSAGVTRRIARYVNANRSVPVMVMTGTPGRKSIRDYSHHLVWTLKERAPVPLDMDELEAWASALDVNPPRGGMRMGIGALAQLGGFGGLQGTREAFRQRLVETPGVIIFNDVGGSGKPLRVRFLAAPADDALEQAFERFRLYNESPGGDIVSDVLSRLRIGEELGIGGFHEYEVPPPEPWRDARRAACKLVRDVVETRPLDTEAQVFQAYRHHPVVSAWREIRPTFRPKSKWSWLSRSVVDAAVAWLRQAGPRALVWVQQTAVGRAIAEAAGVPYFGQGGLDAKGNRIDDGKFAGPAVLSFKANITGRNLQFGWNRNLMIGCSPSAEELEQYLSRTDRSGQESEIVSFDFLVVARETRESWAKALEEAEFVSSTQSITYRQLKVAAEPADLGNRSGTQRFGLAGQ